MGFDSEAFLEWLDDLDRPVYADELEEEWPNFPSEELFGSTGPIHEGKMAYYRHDLRTVAKGRRITD